MPPNEAARAFIADFYPTCLAAFLGGSVAAGRGTATSDLDILVITKDDGARRETLRAHGWLIETFVHTVESFERFLAMNPAD